MQTFFQSTRKKVLRGCNDAHGIIILPPAIYVDKGRQRRQAANMSKERAHR